MTDLEITRLCAEAMGFIPYRLRANGVIQQCGNGIYVEDAHLERGYCEYTPLRDDAQAMALAKKFDMVIEREKDRSFGVTLFGNAPRNGWRPTFVSRNQPDLNRAICECVAKMQAAKT